MAPIPQAEGPLRAICRRFRQHNTLPSTGQGRLSQPVPGRLTVVPVAKAAVKNMAHARLLHFEVPFAIFLCLDYAGYAFQNLHAEALKGADLPRIVGLQW